MERLDLPNPDENPDAENEPKKKMIKIICSECKAYLGEKEGVETDRDITHSYCEKCKNEALAELEKYK